MTALLLIVKLFVNPEIPHPVATEASFKIPVVEVAPPEINRRCTRAEQAAANEYCILFGRGLQPRLQSCNVATDPETKKLTCFITCQDTGNMTRNEAVQDGPSTKRPR